MVTNNPEDGHPFSKGWSPTISKMDTQHPQEDHPPFKGWSPTNQRKATHHHLDGHQLSQGYGHTPSPGWTLTNIRMVSHHPWDSYPHTNTVTHHLQDGQIDLECDSCAAQLVILLLLGGFKKCFLSKISPVKSIWWGDAPWISSLFFLGGEGLDRIGWNVGGSVLNQPIIITEFDISDCLYFGKFY